MIDFYQFGEIVVEGRVYNSDVIIFPDRVREWWRQEGHQVNREDLAEVLDWTPEVIILGTGYSDMVAIPQELRRFLEEQGIELLAQPTEKACHTYNEVSQKQRTIAALHLTC